GQDGAPAVLRLEGQYGTCGTEPGWQLDGELIGGDDGTVTFDGFRVTGLTAEGCVDSGGLELLVTGAAVIGEGPASVPVGFTLRFDHGAWEIDGDVGPFDLTVGPIAISDAELTFDIDGGAGGIGLTI